jgi:hypothetical protein
MKNKVVSRRITLDQWCYSSANNLVMSATVDQEREERIKQTFQYCCFMKLLYDRRIFKIEDNNWDRRSCISILINVSRKDMSRINIDDEDLVNLSNLHYVLEDLILSSASVLVSQEKIKHWDCVESRSN